MGGESWCTTKDQVPFPELMAGHVDHLLLYYQRIILLDYFSRKFNNYVVYI